MAITVYKPTQDGEYYLTEPLNIDIGFGMSLGMQEPYDFRGRIQIIDKYGIVVFDKTTTDMHYIAALNVSGYGADVFTLRASVEFRFLTMGIWWSNWAVAEGVIPVAISFTLKEVVAEHILDVYSTPIAGISGTIDTKKFTTTARLMLPDGIYMLSINSLVEYGNKYYKFKEWSDGIIERTRSLSLYSDVAITAKYEETICLADQTKCENENLYTCTRQGTWDLTQEKTEETCNVITSLQYGQKIVTGKCVDGKWQDVPIPATWCLPAGVECRDGAVECRPAIGQFPYSLYQCIGGKMTFVKSNATECGYVPEKPWYDWFTQETLMPGVQNWVLVVAGIAIPVTIGGVAYWALRKK